MHGCLSDAEVARPWQRPIVRIHSVSFRLALETPFELELENFLFQAELKPSSRINRRTL